MIGVRLGVGHHFSGGFDSSASAFFAATGITGTTEQQAVNTLVTSLKSAGLWSKMKAVYPFVTDNRNLLSYSEDFSNAYWNKYRMTITGDTTTAPNGTTTADTLSDTAVNDAHQLYASLLSMSPNTYTFGFYVKAKDSTKNLAIYPFTISGAGGTGGGGVILTQTGTFVANIGAGVSSYNSVNVGNGWYRISVTGYTTNTSELRPIIGFANGSNQTYLGDTTGVYIWGAQLELGSTATTYQPIATTQQSYISNQFKYNLVNPVDSDAAFRGVFNGGWTFSNQGALPNGTNGYMDTKLNQASVLTLNSSHFSYYSRTNSQIDGFSGTTASSVLVGCQLYLRGGSYNNEIRAVIGQSGAGQQEMVASNTNSQGFYTLKRTSDVNSAIFKNGISIATNTTQAIGVFGSYTLYLAARNNLNSAQYFDNRQCAFSSIGDGLTDTEATALYNAVQTFNTSLSRQV